ncbi:acylneuraminate cytidylyltransferase [Candidatus Atribacteria bacterium HGW-Atribacteria-1]|nr:MAG: acylneuraminate cytidylyltransferase [Candidatus Atribacteria bacterium HGW-Atribacteria-1]
MKQLFALLPMKEHSERIPNKNMRDFCGKPLYHKIMESLLKSKYIESVVIDTDSKIIAEDALKNFDRVEIINRSEKLRGDFVPMNDIIACDLSQLRGEYFLQTHSTNPLLTADTINKAIEQYFENIKRYDSLFSVTRFQARLYGQDGSAINHNPNELLRTQDLSPIFEENSNLYIFSKKSFREAGNKRIGLNPQMFEMSKFESIDIDELGEFELAKILYKLRGTR